MNGHSFSGAVSAKLEVNWEFEEVRPGVVDSYKTLSDVLRLMVRAVVDSSLLLKTLGVASPSWCVLKSEDKTL
uniref:Uncharacterized protein n=1 Tax=Solanum tuberosum TaxID=4113 RepID=M1D8U2_SOLTU